MLFSSTIISQAQITFDIVRRTMAEHVDLSKFANDSNDYKPDKRMDSFELETEKIV